VIGGCLKEMTIAGEVGANRAQVSGTAGILRLLPLDWTGQRIQIHSQNVCHIDQD
jgi:hypothetical protein